jgi:hypothetical protein
VAKGGNCQVAWGAVCRPMELGGLSVSSLKELSWALQIRWLWPWMSLSIQVLNKAKALFSVAMQTEIGDGTNTLFWSDRWLHGQRIADLAPRLLATVPKRRINNRTVCEALTAGQWVTDIQGPMTVGVIMEFLYIWDMISSIELWQGINDSHFWRVAADRKYSAKSAYDKFFLGSISFEPYQRISKSWAPSKCHFFLWLAAQKKCWTADRLARHGMSHLDKCPLCDQEEETIDHLLITCVFVRQFWFTILRQLNLQDISLQPDDRSFLEWWRKSNLIIGGAARRGLNSIIILGAWVLWKHRNRCGFDVAAPSLAAALSQAGEDRLMWEVAGARGLSSLAAPLPVG